MIYLLLAILSSALISILMRLSGAHIRNNLSLLAVNYVLCALFAALEAAPGLLPQGSGSGVAIGLGVMTGIFYLASFILFQWNVSINGVVFSATFMKLGVLVPTALSVFLFHELPSVLQVLGFIGALAAIVLIQSDGGEAKAANRPALILLLLGGGLCDATPKIYAQLGPPALERAFLFYAFLVAMVLCIALVLWKKQRLGRAELLFGLLISIPNYFSARFLLLAVNHVPAVVAYPTYSVGTIVVVSIAGLLFFREQISRRWFAAFGLILASLVLLNL
ncbi:SMR family transporter [Lawsonibacter celer]|uniref:SMR family transporter n=1 Tax=Lawsonibacter celer TaxID=2986526 RepID=UPI00164824E0|nr:SMR family transporter [Lawsonibacter celer]